MFEIDREDTFERQSINKYYNITKNKMSIGRSDLSVKLQSVCHNSRSLTALVFPHIPYPMFANPPFLLNSNGQQSHKKRCISEAPKSKPQRVTFSLKGPCESDLKSLNTKDFVNKGLIFHCLYTYWSNVALVRL